MIKKSVKRRRKCLARNRVENLKIKTRTRQLNEAAQVHTGTRTPVQHIPSLDHYPFLFLSLSWFNLNQQPRPMQMLTHLPTSRIGERIARVKNRKLVG